MKLRVPDVVFLFGLGALAALIGDHGHVVTGTTEYLVTAVPFVWSSPIWFPLLVGSATVALAELRLHLPTPRSTVGVRQGLAGVLAVIAIYVVTALVHAAPAVPASVLIYALAIITWCVLGDGPGAVCGMLAAIGGPALEAVLAQTRVISYAADSNALCGVAPWLPALYFAFGVVAALLAEIAAARRRPTVEAR
ncbi:hypothetical protein H7H78_08665 [Mycobacterium shinjukuense]|uniref:Uncharacterized protein n=1 Tax=Mycobacterium shinjukuense TaxID=398694 RepID=A0A7I7MK75_9MYCO|nr:hypothetical protein [Mycobacterium shinjukuense]MCV6985501.1 hypothetical protein [Mycobacterium shinjukuense]ORB66559.1 hypothetical protein BST45_13435 [Mycobacterium shinjukuense]BBX72724.1 hypothetical protein MSHI_06300 [Mycobacterium shinjukuense]